MRAYELSLDVPVLAKQRRPDFRASFVASALSWVARVVTGIEVADEAGVLAETVPMARVYVANHSSHADILLLWAALPGALRLRTHPVAAADYWQRGAVRRYLAENVFRSVLVERQMRDRRWDPTRPMVEALRRGDSLILFPEGTRGDGKTVGEFRCGVYHLVQALPTLEVVPVWLENVHRVLPKGAKLPAPLRCAIRFGAPIRVRSSEDKGAFLGRVRGEVCSLGERCRLRMSAC